MNERIEHCLYQAGLTAQGCWDELDDYARQGIEKFAELIVKECVEICMKEFDTGLLMAPQAPWIAKQIREHFGVEE